MKLSLKIVLYLTVLMAGSINALEVGDQAPNFSLQGTDGKT